MSIARYSVSSMSHSDEGCFIFIDVKWTVIKRDYLKGSNKKDNILLWVRFLRKLGVKQGIAVQRDNVNVMEVSDIKAVHP